MVTGFYRSPLGVITGVMLHVHVDEPAAVVVVVKDMPRVYKGQRLFVRGQLASEQIAGQPWPLLCVMAKSIEVLAPRKEAHA